MEYDWGEKKYKRNLVKHGVAFELIADFDWESAVISCDDRYDYKETRFVAFGRVGARLYACVYTMRDGKRRLISLRKANHREENFYESQTIDIEIETLDE